MIIDQELFELCKMVHKLTRWETKDKITIVTPMYDPEHAPLYTSDYLLEKLPPALWIYSSKEGRKIVHLLNIARQGDKSSVASYDIPYDEEFRGAYQSRSDTTLKALLKLTLALHGAGELRSGAVNNE